MGVVGRIGTNVKNLKLGQCVVTSFRIAYECDYCK